MIGAMVMSILAIVALILFSATMIFGTVICDASVDTIADLCTNAAGGTTCCWGCGDVAACAASGCEWEPAAKRYEPVYAEGSTNVIGTYVSSDEEGRCTIGTNGQVSTFDACTANAAAVAANPTPTSANPHANVGSCPTSFLGDNYCDNAADCASANTAGTFPATSTCFSSTSSPCSSGLDTADCGIAAGTSTSFNTYCNDLTDVASPGTTWANTGCDHTADGNVASEHEDFCNAVTAITGLVIIELILVFAISISGCCVAWHVATVCACVHREHVARHPLSPCSCAPQLRQGRDGWRRRLQRRRRRLWLIPPTTAWRGAAPRLPQYLLTTPIEFIYLVRALYVAIPIVPTGASFVPPPPPRHGATARGYAQLASRARIFHNSWPPPPPPP
eukprot:COSAG05_NODE_2260_length_3322_cov_2.870307_1_plen_391_part_00